MYHHLKMDVFTLKNVKWEIKVFAKKFQMLLQRIKKGSCINLQLLVQNRFDLRFPNE